MEKYKDIIKSELPFGFENFPSPLQDIYIWYVKCQINVNEIGNEIRKLEKIINEKRRIYLNSMEEVKKATEKIKSYFIHGNYSGVK